MNGLQRWRLASAKGQSLLEFALTLPLLLVVVLGIAEFGYALLDQQIVTRLSREGSSLISRGTSLQDAAAALKTMSARPVNLNGDSKLILSVVKRGASTGTANYDKLVLYQRYSIGNGKENSKLETRGSGSFGPAPDYTALNSDTNTGLQLKNPPNGLIIEPGGLVYVTELFSAHKLISPLDNFGIKVPTRLYSIAYF